MIEDITAASLVELVKTSFSKLFGDLGQDSKAFLQAVRFSTIGRDAYARYIADVIGTFPLFASTRTASVESCYVRLVISDVLEHQMYRSTEAILAALESQRQGGMDFRELMGKAKTPFEALERSPRGLALIGSAGSGKTTIFKHLAVELAKGRTLRGKRRMPLFLAVRDMTDSEVDSASGETSRMGVKAAATRFFRSLGLQDSDKVFDKLFEQGRLILLLDGLDETDSSHQKAILREVQQLQGLHPESLVCISSRPISLSIGLAGFIKWETLRLAKDQRLEFVRKWFTAVDSAKGDRLLLECRQRPEMLDLGSNPLLLSIVCALYNNDLEIPSERDELYKRAVEGLLGGWDTFRNISRQTPLRRLSITKRLALVSHLAEAMFERGHVVFNEAIVERSGCLPKVAGALREQLPSARGLLESLYNDYGILVERSPGYYSFSHLTLHEYLVARYVVDHRREKFFLLRYRNDDRYHEIIRMIAKMLLDAGLFLTHLMGKLEIKDASEVALAESVMDLRPICSRPVMLEITKSFSARLLAAIDGLRWSLNVAPPNLVVVAKEQESVDAHEAVAFALSGLRTIRASGFKYSELGITWHPLIKRLITAGNPFLEGIVHELPSASTESTNASTPSGNCASHRRRRRRTK